MTDVLLRLGAIGTGVLLHQFGGVGSLLAGQFLDLVGLGVNDILSVLNLGINDFAVVDIDKRTKVGDGDSDQRQTPQRKDLDKPVGKEGSGEGLYIRQIQYPVNFLIILWSILQQCG